MKVVYSELHHHHNADTGTWVGITIPSDEVADRIERVVEALVGRGHEIVAAREHDDSILEAVHDRDMIDYMRNAWEIWVEWGYPDDPGQNQVAAYAFPTSRFLGDIPLRLPRSPGALAGVYAMDTMTQIGEGTFLGARAAVDTAQTAADIVLDGEKVVYAACRPPGHHAGTSFFGGSCYLNNAAVAAQTFIGGGMGRVAIVDIDAHHGNGTQEIFYRRRDVVYGSVHVDPGEGWFPHFLGYADEIGAGEGVGFNLNEPVPPGCGDDVWLAALDGVTTFVEIHQPDAVVVSLGVDAAITDPESPLQITKFGYEAAGKAIASLGLPTVFVQEGGYDLNTIGELVGATLNGFETARL
ncbi:MAG TPA: histone deacetylase family protein [Acidimicrobiia bacterium]